MTVEVDARAVLFTTFTSASRRQMRCRQRECWGGSIRTSGWREVQTDARCGTVVGFPGGVPDRGQVGCPLGAFFFGLNGEGRRDSSRANCNRFGLGGRWRCQRSASAGTVPDP